MRNQVIEIENNEIILFTENNEEFISLTDMARFKNTQSTGLVISHWLSTRYTIEFMGLWEKLNNPNFNVTGFSYIRNESGSNGFVLSAKQWISKTNSIGIRSKPGRYGGTFAHKDIAFEFGSWISPQFKYYLIKEFQRLKEEEQKQLNREWNIQRLLAKVNYQIHTDAVKENLIPDKLTRKQISFVYATEADILNMALFGVTAKQWRISNTDKKGNIRDHANISQLVCLSNLESINSVMIRQGAKQSDRLIQLNDIAISQMTSLVKNKNLKKLK
ncbi:MAG: KilA-N domain-containing protein [Candidatus Delongbacteria bacterium]|nr:KilA-N domain-containing protein [Candidatus Delongbacteria bacterium]